MILGTHVPQTILCVTFGARLRSVPVRLLDDLFGNFVCQDTPRIPERLAKRPVGPPPLRMDAFRTCFGMPAATSGPPVAYLP